MRELNYLAAGKLAWVERRDPTLQTGTTRWCVRSSSSRCDGDTLPIHNRRVSRAMQAGLKVGPVAPAVGAR